MFSSQRFQHICVGRITGLGLFLCRQAQMLKQHLSQLFWRIDVKLFSCQMVDDILIILDLFIQHFTVLCQCSGVHLKAVHLHRSQHLGQRHFDVLQQSFLFIFVYLLAQCFMQRCKAGTVLQKLSVLFFHFFHGSNSIQLTSSVIACAQAFDIVFRTVCRKQVGRQQQIICEVAKFPAPA